MTVNDGEKITAWITANLSLGVIGGWLSRASVWLDVLVPLGQLAVAVVTVIYIVKKIRRVRNKRTK